MRNITAFALGQVTMTIINHAFGIRKLTAVEGGPDSVWLITGVPTGSPLSSVSASGCKFANFGFWPWSGFAFQTAWCLSGSNLFPHDLHVRSDTWSLERYVETYLNARCDLTELPTEWLSLGVPSNQRQTSKKGSKRLHNNTEISVSFNSTKELSWKPGGYWYRQNSKLEQMIKICIAWFPYRFLSRQRSYAAVPWSFNI